MFDKFLSAVAKTAIDTVVKVIEETLRSAGPERTDRTVGNGAGRSESRSATGSTPRAERTPRRPSAPSPKPSTIHEEVTAVLRRQVPPRDEAPSSWIGGLPMLPVNIDWPRARNSEYPDKGEIPLNFLAQIACSDLPHDLWGGFGPRDGWLVFFGASWGCCSFEDAGSFRAYHIPKLGEERQPPADKLSVGDPTYSGGDNPALIYERWPVDIVTVKNSPEFPGSAPWCGGEPPSPIPPDFAKILYDGAPVGERHWRPEDKPFTWGAIAMMLEDTLRNMAHKSAHHAAVKRLASDGRDLALVAIGEEEAGLAAPLQNDDPEREARRAIYVEQRRAEFAERRSFMARAGEPFDPEKLAEMVEASQADRKAWLGQQKEVMEALLAEASAHAPHVLLSTEDHQRLDSLFSAKHSQWHMGTVAPRNRVNCPEKTTLSLSDLVSRARPQAVARAACDLYRAGERERASLPEDMRAALEADLRRLEYNRPHRLGGFHQPVQQTVAPTGNMLLLQLGTDEPTGFRWGDSGALFAWIEVDTLKHNDFSDVKWWTENT